MDVDVIVIGAGVAGLAAASELGRHKLTVLVLEARDRIGGRVWSVAPRGWTQPVELGAEFVHGGNGALRKLLHRGRIGTYPNAEEMWWRQDGELRRIPDFWERIAAVAEKISVRKQGGSFDEFLRSTGRLLPAEDRWLAEHYAGSFNAAPVSALSAAVMREDHGGADNTDFKVAGRYDRVVEELRRQLPEDRVTLWLRTEVTEVRWRRGAVSVVTRGSGAAKVVETHRAQAVVVTLPLGVLKAGSVTFTPGLGHKQSLLERLGWGQVVRITFRFRPGIWKLVPAHVRRRKNRFTGFLNAPGEAFPVWWALTPSAPILTAWAGGEAARDIVGLSLARQVRVALGSLASILGTTSKAVRAQLVGWQTHDWHGDPYARGAYSYAVAGSEDGPRQLAKPLARTLFFAGEATAKDLGTVHGALESGLFAAREIVAKGAKWKMRFKG